VVVYILVQFWSSNPAVACTVETKTLLQGWNYSSKWCNGS